MLELLQRPEEVVTGAPVAPLALLLHIEDEEDFAWTLVISPTSDRISNVI